MQQGPGLKDLIELNFPQNIITHVFGCRYEITIPRNSHENTNPENELIPESVPVFCMDETMKTRSLFEISKGSFCFQDRPVNKKISDDDLWCPFENMIYIGDGDTDIPSLSLTRSRGGLGIGVYDTSLGKEKAEKRLRSMSMDKRADFICPAEFDVDGQLYSYIKNRCIQIMQRYRAQNFTIA